MAGTTLIFDILAKDRASGTFKAFGKEIDNLDKKARGLSHLGDIGGKVALGATAGIAAIVGVTANFEKAMSGVAAATGEGEAGMNALRDAALQAGADTAFSASEAAAGMTALSKAGVTTQDILGGGLTGALDLAAAGELDVAAAAEIAATTMTQFGLAGEDVSHIADVLAAAAGKAQGEVTDMSAALNYVAPVAAQMGISLEETAGSIALLAEQGILGSQAGTSLRGMLTSLTSPSRVAKEEMEKYGISLYDTSGNMIGFDGIAQQLQDTMGDLGNAERDAALGRIFGNEQITAARILYSGGAEAVADWTDKVNDSGFAAEQAATKLDNLAGDFEALKGSLETALIGAGTDSQGPLRKMVQGLTNAVNAFNDLPGPAQNATTALLGITAVLGGGLWFSSKVVQGIADTRSALSDLGVQAGTTKRALVGIGSAGLALAAAIPIVRALNDAIIGDSRNIGSGNIRRELDSISQGLSTVAVDDFVDQLGSLDGSFAGLHEFNRELNSGFGMFGDTMSDSAAKNIAEIDEALASLVESGASDQAIAAVKNLTDAYAEAGGDVGDVTGALTEYRQALINAGLEAPGAFLSDLAAGALGATGPTKDLAGATGELGGEADTAKRDIRGLVDAMYAQRDAAIAAFDAETQYREALKAARGQAAKNEAGIQGNTAAALENRNALGGLAAAWNNQSDAVRNNTAKFKEAKTAFIQTAVAMGVPIAKARELARELLAIPKQTVVGVNANTEDALGRIRTVKTELAGIDRYIPITLHVQRTGDGGTGLEYGSGLGNPRLSSPRLSNRTLQRGISRATQVAHVAPSRRVIEVRVVGGELDLTKSKVQLDAFAREVARDEIRDERVWQRGQSDG